MNIILKRGNSGENVKSLQKALGIVSDGIFGLQTELKVKQFQQKNNLKADGIVGEKTQKALGLTFAINENTKTEKQDITISKQPITKNITKKSRTIQYIVIHYTAGSSSVKGKAKDIRNVFQNSNRSASADFVVDDETIVQCNPDLKNYYCWAVGDGKGKYGISNSNSISIEMCSTLKRGTSVAQPNHSGWSISDKVLENTIKLTKHLMTVYKIPLDKVVRHYDATLKSCPGIISWNNNPMYDENGKPVGKKNNSSGWEQFKKKLQ